MDPSNGTQVEGAQAGVQRRTGRRLVSGLSRVRACREEAHVAEAWPLSREWFLWAGTGGRWDGRQAGSSSSTGRTIYRCGGRGISFYEDIGHMVMETVYF